MTHTRISIYELVDGDYIDMTTRAVDELGGSLSGEPGFRSYAIGRDHDGNVVVINEWDSAEQAEAALPQAAEWIRQNLSTSTRLVRSHIVEITGGTNNTP